MARAVTPAEVLAAVETIMLRPFEWGPCDCCSAACDVFGLIWGIDPMAHLRGQYIGLRGAAALIRENGGLMALAQSMAAHVGLIEGHASGGVAISIDQRSLMICIAPEQWAAKSETGFVVMSRAAKGWRLA